MSELGDLLELAHGAEARWRTIMASGRQWSHQARRLEAFTRAIPENAATITFRSDTSAQEPAEIDTPWRLWLEPPDWVRSESTEPPSGGSYVIVRVGRRVWWRSEANGARTIEEDEHHQVGLGPAIDLLDPAPMFALTELEILGRTAVIGRPAIRVRAVPLQEDLETNGRMQLHGFGSGADEYELLMDAERGVVLRIEARLGGEPFFIHEVQEIVYDAALPPQTFVLELEAGEEFETPQEHRDVALTDLQDAVAFTVVPEALPGAAVSSHTGLDGHAMIQPADRRNSTPLTVHITYAWSGGNLTLRETDEETPTREHQALEERDGMLAGEDQTTIPSRNTVRVQLQGTHIELSGVGLSVDELVELTGRLVALPSGSPSLRRVTR